MTYTGGPFLKWNVVAMHARINQGGTETVDVDGGPAANWRKAEIRIHNHLKADPCHMAIWDLRVHYGAGTARPNRFEMHATLIDQRNPNHIQIGNEIFVECWQDDQYRTETVCIH